MQIIIIDKNKLNEDTKWLIDKIVAYENETFGNEKYNLESIKSLLDTCGTYIIVACDEKVFLGYAIINVNVDFTDIYKIGVVNDYKKKGIGTAIFNEIEKLAKENNSQKIMLEVRSENNVAISFYKKCKMNILCERKKYYNNPCDDAIIFEKEFLC